MIVAFPSTPLGIMVELALGADLTAVPTTWQFTDITQYTQPNVTISRGRPDEFATAPAARATLQLLNDGRFVPRNPTGAYYGQLARNTPLRIMVRPDTNSLSDTFTRTVSNGWGTADLGGIWTTSGTAADFSVNATFARMTHPATVAPHYAVLGPALTRFDMTCRVRTSATASGAPRVSGLVWRYADASNNERMEIRFNIDQSISVRAVERVAGVDFVAAGPTTVPGLTHVANTFYWMRVQSAGSAGQLVRCKVWLDGTAEPPTWHLQTATFSNPTAGKVGCFSVRETGNTNANAAQEFDDFSYADGWRIRFTGGVDEWPVRWGDISTSQAYAPITASGVLRRLGQGGALRSGLFRAHTLQTYATTPTAVGYWSMEDPTGSTWFSSGIGGRAMSYVQDMSFAADSSIAGSDPLPTGGPNAVFSAPIPPYPASTVWATRWVMKIPTAPSANTGLMAWGTLGTIQTWVLRLIPGSPAVVKLTGITAAGTEVLADAGLPFTDQLGSQLYGRQLYFEVNGVQNAGNIDWNYNIWYSNFGVGGTGSVAGTVGNAYVIYHSAVPGLAAGYTVGHVAVANNSAFGAGADGAVGYANETVAFRLIRLCNEQNLSSFQVGSTVQKMGAQSSTSMLSQLREVEATEEGVLFDGGQGYLYLLTRQGRQNRAVDLTLDVNGGQVGWPLQPTDDDQQLRNDVTATRSGGRVGARAVNQAHARANGVYQSSLTVNSSDDTDLPYHAQWRVHLGTVEDLRYPQVPLNLTRNTTLIETWLNCEVGSRIQVTHAPAVLPPDPLDLHIEGWTEHLDAVSWTVDLNTSPAQPWQVFELEAAGNLGRLDTAGSSLNTAITTTGQTSLSIATSSGPLWSTTSTPYDIEIGGERMTATVVAGSSSPQTVTVTRAVNGVVKTHLVGAAVKLWRPGVWAL